MNYGEIKYCDIANGSGVRVTLFVSGCRNHCKNCFNPMTWSFEYGQKLEQKTIDEVIAHLKMPFIQGLTILGGEPFEPENQKEVLDVILKVRQEVPNKNIWVYSGFTFEELMGQEESRASLKEAKQILENIDVLVDGRYVDELRDIRLKFRGSRNQRIIDVPNTLKQNKAVLLDL